MQPKRMAGFDYENTVGDPRYFANWQAQDDMRRQMMEQQAAMANQPKDRGLLGSIGDFVGGAAKSIAKPFVQGANTLFVEQPKQIVDTIRMMTADATGNTEAWKNANESSKRHYDEMSKESGGLLNMGGYFSGDEARQGDLGTGVKRVGGNLAQQLATVAPIGGGGALAMAGKGALSGAAYGAGEGLASDRSLEDILKQAGTGAAFGGAIGAAPAILRGIRHPVKSASAAGTGITSLLKKEGHVLDDTLAGLKRSAAGLNKADETLANTLRAVSGGADDLTGKALSDAKVAKISGQGSEMLREHEAKNLMSFLASPFSSADDAASAATKVNKLSTLQQNPGKVAVQSIDNVPLDQLTTSRPADAVQDQIEKLLNSGDRAGAEKLLPKLPADMQKSMQSVMGVPQDNLLTRLGMRARGASGGIKPGKEFGAIANADDLVRSERLLNLHGTPAQKARQADQLMKNISAQVDDQLQKSPVKLNGGQVTSKLSDALDDPTAAMLADLDVTNPSVMKVVQRHLDKVGKLDNAYDLNQYVKTLNRIASPASQKLNVPGKVLTAQETAALAVKRAADDVLGAVPAIKPLKKQMATLFQLQPMYTTASQKSVGVPIASGIGSVGLRQMGKGAEDLIGRGMIGLGQIGGKLTGSIPSPVGSAIREKTPIALLAGLFGQDEPVDQGGGQVLGASTDQMLDPMADPGMSAPMGGQMPPMGGGMGAPGAGGGMPPPNIGGAMRESRYPLENFMKDVNRDLETTGGENYATFANLYQTIQEAENPQGVGGAGGGGAGVGGTGLNVTRPTSEKYSNAVSGIQSLEGLEQLIQGDPGVLGRTRMPGRGITALGIGSTIRDMTGTGDFDALAFDAVDNLLRIRTGATAPVEEVRKYMSNYIPQADDSPEVIRRKINTMRGTFGSILDLGQGAASTSPDLQSALMASGAY